MRIYEDPDPGQTLPSQKAKHYLKNYFMKLIVIEHTYRKLRSYKSLFELSWISGLFVNLVDFLAPEYGSGSALPIRIRNQERQINADPDPQHWPST
jgi:hypothetical protein